MKKYITLLLVFISLESFASLEKIVAIVNDDPITLKELDDRKKMIAFLSHVDTSDSKENSKLAKVAIDTLIDEALLEQEQKNLHINVSDAEIDKNISNIEESNNMTAGQLQNALEENGVSYSSFRKKVKIDTLKYKMVSEFFAPDVTISTSQFESVILNQKVKDADVSLKIITSKDNDKVCYNKMYQLTKKINGCNILSSKYASFAYVEEVKTKFSKLDNATKNLVRDLKANSHSSVIKMGENFKIIILCDKKIDNLTPEENNYLSNFIINKKVSLELKKYLNRLRNKAYIKIL